MPLRFYWEIFQEFVKKYGRYPYGRELDKIKDLAKEKEASQKVVELGPKLPEDAPFSTKNPTGWMDDVPQKPSTPKKPETEAEMLDRMKRENKEAVERLKEKKKTKTAEDIIDEGDFDPSGMKDGGRIKKEKDVIDLSTPEGIEEFKKIAPGLLRREYPKVRKITEDDKKTRTEKAGGGPSKNRLAQLLDILEGTTDLDDRRLIQQEIDQILGKYESGGRVSKGLDYLMGL